jgi:hypothetical protein
VYSLTSRWSRDNVKRPAPGGEGRNINPYSRRSLDNYLTYFSGKIGDLPKSGIRAQFHDSFEYEGNWCDEFLAEFEKRRGYKLQEHLPELDGKGEPDAIARVKHDYRETLSDLVLDNLIRPWTEWSHANGMLARNQSHGSPANWLDLYAAVDIPETESFGRLVGGDGHPLLFKFASSAANVMGRKLVSSETATWLDEHFHVTLGQIKEMVDRQMLAGVNHVFYHGTAYSPQDAAWPGWVFYASTQLNPQNPIWRDLPALNAYVTRCQSILQSTKPDNDVLLYWPIHDLWQDANGLRMDLQVHNALEWLLGTQFGRTAQWLDERGYSFDYISDRQIMQCEVSSNQITTPGGKYKTIVIPKAKYLPIATLRKLLALADAGATVIFQFDLPGGPPGVYGPDVRTEWDSLLSKIRRSDGDPSSQRSVNMGQGRVVMNDDLSTPLDAAQVRREFRLKQNSLNYVRRASSGGHVYLIRNEGTRLIDTEVSFASPWQSAYNLDPLVAERTATSIRIFDAGGRTIRVTLAPGQTIFIKTSPDEFPGLNEALASAKAGLTSDEPTHLGELLTLQGTWSVEFIEGGPELPASTKVESTTPQSAAVPPGTLPPPWRSPILEPWTKFAGEVGERFAGTVRYRINFDVPAAGRYLIAFGSIADSARVIVNGKAIATLIAPPFSAEAELKQQNNELIVEVTNVAANRIRDMDRRGVEWKIFKDINMVDISYRPLDASRWPIREAGLLGPVTITSLPSARKLD